jgi:hypothetical protein
MPHSSIYDIHMYACLKCGKFNLSGHFWILLDIFSTFGQFFPLDRPKCEKWPFRQPWVLNNKKSQTKSACDIFSFRVWHADKYSYSDSTYYLTYILLLKLPCYSKLWILFLYCLNQSRIGNHIRFNTIANILYEIRHIILWYYFNT